MTSPDTDRHRQPGRVTLEHVAREAAVSKATASRVLNGGPRTVGEEHRRRVLAAAERLGYRADLLAQATSKGTTPTVALVVGDIRDPFCARVARGVIDRSASEDLVVTISSSSTSAGDELAVLRALRGHAPRVTILATSSHHVPSSRRRLIAALHAMASDGRVVVVGRAGLPFDTVLTDEPAAAQRLIAVLAQRGYRAPLVLVGRSDLEGARQREQGFRDGLAAAGLTLPANAVVRCAADRDGAFQVVSGLSRSRLTRHDVVICGNDLMAVGAMSALRRRGLRPGTDIAVTGFDDVPAARDVRPTLTTVHVPLHALGVAAVELALGKEHAAPRIVQHDLTVVLRDSTPNRR